MNDTTQLATMTTQQQPTAQLEKQKLERIER